MTSRKNFALGRRRTVLGLGAAALLAIPVAVSGAAGGWSGIGGDAGHSGNQPVRPGVLPIELKYPKRPGTDTGTEGTLRTSIVTSNGADASTQTMSYGRYVKLPIAPVTAAAKDQNRIVMRKLSDGALISTVDVDSNTGTADTNVDIDAFGPLPGGVTPVSSSSGVDRGQLYVVHNDDNSAAQSTAVDGCTVPSPTTTTASLNDIAIAQVNETSGAKVKDVAVGRAQSVGSLPNCTVGTEPQVTDGYTIESSPVLTPKKNNAGTGDRSLVFVAKHTDAAKSRLYRIDIDNAGDNSAVIKSDFPAFRELPNINTKASPTIAYLRDPSRPNVIVPYVLVSFDAAAGASDIRAFKVADLTDGPAVAADLPGKPGTPSVPVSVNGLVPGESGAGAAKAPLIYAAYEVGDTTVVRSFEQVDDATTLTQVAETDTPVAGKPAGMALAQDVVDGFAEPGRVVVTTDKNLWILDTETLEKVQALQDETGSAAEDLLVPPRGFSRNIPLVSGGLIYVTREDGAQLVLSLANGDPVPGLPTGFEEDDDNNTSNFAIGQPAYSRGMVQFISDRLPDTPPEGGAPASPTPGGGLFVYTASLRPDVTILSPPNGGQVSGSASLLQAKITDPDGIVDATPDIAEARFKIDGELIATVTTADDGAPTMFSTTIDTFKFSEGLHRLTVEGVDQSGLVGTDETLFTVNNFTAPSAVLKIDPVGAQPTDTPIILDAI